MSENLNLALQITVVGMSLVFITLGLFAVVMAVVVRVTAEQPARAEPASTPLAADSSRQARAAAAGVALALAQARHAETTKRPPPPTATVSPWQAARRANQMRRGGRTR